GVILDEERRIRPVLARIRAGQLPRRRAGTGRAAAVGIAQVRAEALRVGHLRGVAADTLRRCRDAPHAVRGVARGEARVRLESLWRSFAASYSAHGVGKIGR